MVPILTRSGQWRNIGQLKEGDGMAESAERRTYSGPQERAARVPRSTPESKIRAMKIKGWFRARPSKRSCALLSRRSSLAKCCRPSICQCT